jgi:predicted nuclease of predicted toxin-antitoxin system
MKLLLDENLSRRVVPFLQTDFPGTSQVALEGLEQADDAAIWQYAKANGFVIVTKDSDFQELSLLWGAPPKVLWLRSGNTSRAGVVSVLTSSKDQIMRALNDVSTNCVELK